jgi:hypothetical protein
MPPSGGFSLPNTKGNTMRDIKSNIKVAQSLVPLNRTAAGNGAGIDLQGFDSACIEFSAGAIGGTTPSFTFEVQESDDNTTFTAVADADLQGTEPVVTTANGVTVVGYIGAKRYIRAALKTVTGTSPTLDCAANVVLGNPALLPTA